MFHAVILTSLAWVALIVLYFVYHRRVVAKLKAEIANLKQAAKNYVNKL